MKKIVLILFLTLPFQMYAEAVSAKAYAKRKELLNYLRFIEPIVKNFRGDNKDGQPAEYNAPPGMEGLRVQRYNKLKNLYQEGLLYFFEQDYVNSYRRFLEAQLGMEQVLEELSQFYIERTEGMLKAAVEKKNPNNPEDRNLVDISVEYSSESRYMKNFKQERETPFTRRMYNPREFHYVTNRYTIEKNMEMGYRYLAMAKNARIDALKIENNLMKHQNLSPRHRKHRIDTYVAAINLCRDAKSNAINIYKLKYPFDNYYLFRGDSKSEATKDKDGNVVPGQPVVISGVQMDYNKNPYVDFDDRLSPVLDLRIPEQYRVDGSDAMERIHQEEIDAKIKLKWDPERRKELIKSSAAQ